MLAAHLGFFNTSSTRTHVRFQFSTHAAAGGNIAPSTAFEAADLRIYKATDGAAFSATQRSSANGITMVSPFDSLTGFHDVDINLGDNTDAGFYAAGCLYAVVLAPDETVDGQTITAVVLAYFEIGRDQVDVREFGGSAGTFSGGRPEVNVSHWLGTAAATPTVAGVPEVDCTHLNGVAQSLLDLKDFADDGYDPATNKVEGVKLADTLTTYTGNTPQTGDSFARLGAPAGASISVDIAAVKTQVAAIEVDTQDIQSRLPAALVGGRMDSSTGAMAANVLTDAATAADFEAKIADAVWDEALAGHAGAGSAGAALSAAGAAGDPWATALPGAYGAGTAGQIIGDFLDMAVSDVHDRIGAPVGASISADIAAAKAQLVAIEADTQDIQSRLPAALVGGLMASALNASERAAVADKLLGRTRAGGADGGRTVAECLAINRNRWSNSGGTLTVYADDDSTPLWTAAVTLTAGDPVSQVDPA